jgi:hypothetical protein
MAWIMLRTRSLHTTLTHCDSVVIVNIPASLALVDHRPHWYAFCIGQLRIYRSLHLNTITCLSDIECNDIKNCQTCNAYSSCHRSQARSCQESAKRSGTYADGSSALPFCMVCNLDTRTNRNPCNPSLASTSSCSPCNPTRSELRAIATLFVFFSCGI